MSSKHPALPFQFQRAVFFSQLSCYASVQLRRLLIHNSCSLLAHPQPQTSFLPPYFFLFLFLLPQTVILNLIKKNKEKRVLNSLHHSISHFANGLRLLVCVNLRVTSRAGCHLVSSRHFVCGLQHSSSSCYPLHGREQEAMLCWMRRVNILEVR